MTDLTIHDVTVDEGEKVIAHFKVLERRDFAGDFTVTYEYDRGVYVNHDLDGYRACGGKCADGATPSVSLMEYAADLLTEQRPTVEAAQFYSA